VFIPDKPASRFFDACVAIDKGAYGSKSYGCEGLTW
jgi:hypothetical protein